MLRFRKIKVHRSSPRFMRPCIITSIRIIIQLIARHTSSGAPPPGRIRPPYPEGHGMEFSAARPPGVFGPVPSAFLVDATAVI